MIFHTFERVFNKSVTKDELSKTYDNIKEFKEDIDDLLDYKYSTMANKTISIKLKKIETNTYIYNISDMIKKGTCLAYKINTIKLCNIQDKCMFRLVDSTKNDEDKDKDDEDSDEYAPPKRYIYKTIDKTQNSYWLDYKTLMHRIFYRGNELNEIVYPYIPNVILKDTDLTICIEVLSDKDEIEMLINLDIYNYRLAPDLQLARLIDSKIIKATENGDFVIIRDLSQMSFAQLHQTLPWKLPLRSGIDDTQLDRLLEQTQQNNQQTWQVKVSQLFSDQNNENL